MAIYNDSRIVINLDELVAIRSKVINEELDTDEISLLASELKDTLTWDTLYHMVDTHILTYKGNPPVKYGSICLLYTSPSPRDLGKSRMPSSA